jgi:hypothetical protein
VVVGASVAAGAGSFSAADDSNANDNRIKRAASNKKEEELVFLF